MAEQPPKLRVLTRFADGDERVAPLERVGGLGTGDRLGLARDCNNGDAGFGAEAALGEGFPDPGAVVGNGGPFDLELAERHLQILSDLRPGVSAADSGPGLA